MTDTDTTRRILAAAHALLDAEGVEAVTMRRLGAEVGLSAMAVYRHFPNRDALLERLSSDSFEAAARHWAARAASHREPRRRLLAMLDAYLDYGLTHPHLFDHAFAMRRDDARRFPEDFRARRSPTLNLIADAILDLVAKDTLRDGDEWDLAMDLWAHAQGLIALYRAGRFSYDEKKFRTFYLASLGRLIDGIRD